MPPESADVAPIDSVVFEMARRRRRRELWSMIVTVVAVAGLMTTFYRILS